MLVNSDYELWVNRGLLVVYLRDNTMVNKIFTHDSDLAYYIKRLISYRILACFRINTNINDKMDFPKCGI